MKSVTSQSELFHPLSRRTKNFPPQLLFILAGGWGWSRCDGEKMFCVHLVAKLIQLKSLFMMSRFYVLYTPPRKLFFISRRTDSYIHEKLPEKVLKESLANIFSVVVVTEQQTCPDLKAHSHAWHFIFVCSCQEKDYCWGLFSPPHHFHGSQIIRRKRDLTRREVSSLGVFTKRTQQWWWWFIPVNLN